MNIVIVVNLDDDQIRNLEINVSEIEEHAKFAILGVLDTYKDGDKRSAQSIAHEVTSSQEW